MFLKKTGFICVPYLVLFEIVKRYFLIISQKVNKMSMTEQLFWPKMLANVCPSSLKYKGARHNVLRKTIEGY